MILYFDTSSLIKAYVEEPFTDAVRRLLADVTRPNTASSVVIYAETRSALAAAARGKRLTPAAYASALVEFESDWREMRHVGASETLIQLAGDLAEEHALRGFDSIHLASAVTLARALDEPVAFSAFDDRLIAAAVACGLVAA